MLKNKIELENIANHLNKRGIKLYHSCQLLDFISYLKLGGLPSRERLESKGKQFTSFLSDSNDKTNHVWDKVFFNLEDFGKYFHTINTIGTPNVYGPIVFVINPEILIESTDAAITLRSAGASNYSRDAESLTSSEIQNIFSYPDGHSSKKSWIKTISELQKSFQQNGNVIVKSRPEINCTFNDNIFSLGAGNLDYIEDILVDPIMLGCNKLEDRVKKAAREFNPVLESFVHQRFSKNFNLFRQLITFANLYSGTESQLVAESKSLNNSSFDQWVHSYSTKNHFYQLHRYLIYLKMGTISPLKITADQYKDLLSA